MCVQINSFVSKKKTLKYLKDGNVERKKGISYTWFIEPSKLDFMAVETLQSTAAFMLQLAHWGKTPFYVHKVNFHFSMFTFSVQTSSVCLHYLAKKIGLEEIEKLWKDQKWCQKSTLETWN